MARMVKQIEPEAITIFGGIHPTIAPEDCLYAGAVDFVARGEGEITLKEFIEAVHNGRDPREVAGLSWLEGQKIVHSADRLFIENLDEIPPMPYHLFAENRHFYPNFATVMGSRGCPHNCFFCSNRSISGKRYRFYSTDRVVEEITTLVEKYDQALVAFQDDNIAVNKKHFIELCDKIIARGLHKKTAFHGNLRGDDATLEVLQKMKEANFAIIYYGMETGQEHLMRTINKGETVQEVVDAIYRAHDVGLNVGTTIIFGLPGETAADRKATRKLVSSLPLASVRFNTLAPYPGTPAFTQLKHKLTIFPEWKNFSVQHMWESDYIPYVPDGNSRLGLIFNTMWANLSAYVSPKGIYRMLKSPVAGGAVIRLESHWYTSISKLWKIAKVAFILFFRFGSVALRYGMECCTGSGKQ